MDRAASPRINKFMATKKQTDKSAENNGRTTDGKFRKGNAYGWKKGQSGNPGGRPKSKHLTEAAREWLGESSTQHPHLSNAEHIVTAIGEVAKGSDSAALEAAKWLADRTEGRAPITQAIDVTHHNRDEPRIREEAERIFSEYLIACNGDEDKARELFTQDVPTYARLLPESYTGNGADQSAYRAAKGWTESTPTKSR